MSQSELHEPNDSKDLEDFPSLRSLPLEWVAGFAVAGSHFVYTKEPLDLKDGGSRELHLSLPGRLRFCDMLRSDAGGFRGASGGFSELRCRRCVAPARYDGPVALRFEALRFRLRCFGFMVASAPGVRPREN